MDCLFCSIINGDIPSSKVYEDEYVFSFRDINPQAPVHLIVVPKQHIPCTDSINESNSFLISRIFEAIPKIAVAEGLNNGYRVINNCGKNAGQTIDHLHFHILGGKNMGEKIL